MFNAENERVKNFLCQVLTFTNCLTNSVFVCLWRWSLVNRNDRWYPSFGTRLNIVFWTNRWSCPCSDRSTSRRIEEPVVVRLNWIDTYHNENQCLNHRNVFVVVLVFQYCLATITCMLQVEISLHEARTYTPHLRHVQTLLVMNWSMVLSKR